MNKVTLLKGDCFQKLKELEDNSVDSVVTDPPYGIGFMNKEWDSPKKHKELIEREQKRSEERYKEGKSPAKGGFTKGVQPGLPIGGAKEGKWFEEWSEQWAKEAYRVLKPGGYLVSFCAPRMYHRMASGIEDAGFEIRDQIMWVFGSGFPKSHNIGKAIDKMEGNEREVIGTKNDFSLDGVKRNPNKHREAGEAAKEIGHEYGYKQGWDTPVTKGNTEWEGWGTALKPAHEPIVMARKPFKGNVANNVLEWGTGGINVDGCRIAYKDEADEKSSIPGSLNSNQKNSLFGMGEGHQHNTEGRFPANIIFDEEAGKILDEQSGITYSGPTKPKQKYDGGIFGGGNPNKTYEANTGGASRFFYCPKSSKKDRNEGMPEQVPQFTGRPRREDGSVIYKETHPEEWAEVMKTKPRKEKTSLAASEEILQPTTKGTMNTHPTVKPTDLMAYLIRLITPKGGLVLDPFMGSGSTGKAAVREGMSFIGIEREDEYMEIAKSRIEHEQKKNKHQDFFDI